MAQIRMRRIGIRALSSPLLHCLLAGLAMAAATGHAGAAERNAVPFATWLEELEGEARGRGVSDDILRRALPSSEPIGRVIELDRRQPEGTVTYRQYIDRRVSDTRIARGRELLARHRPLLEQVGARYGVQPRFIVALWGLETNYGSYTGGFPVVQALATLAWDPRRSAYFRKEALNALDILQAGHITPEAMKGSWAGAMGQSQFMPSSFLRYARDHDGDGRRDIWTTLPDVFASAANYLANAGWRDDRTWGREVVLPAGFDLALGNPKPRLKNGRSIAEWQALGVRRPGGADLPARADLTAWIVLPNAGKASPAYMVYSNYRSILRWNRSNYFGLSVGLLSDRLRQP